MRRPTSEELDEAIIDTAALLFARHGYSHTSVQQIADAVGYSKTGLLHRFPSKRALRQAVVDQFVAELARLGAAVQDEPVGPGRDRAVLEALVDLALRRRGPLALMVSALTAHERPEDLDWLLGVAEGLYGAFGVTDPTDLDRYVRIYGALGATGVIALAAVDLHQEGIRDLVVDTAFDALGHPRPAEG